jgi:adenosylcobinamide-GDP ribazoletransferase
MLGGALGALWWGAAEWWPLLVASVIVVAADLAATGMLHVDGLADSADGLLPPLPSPERRLAVMADPTIGAFGVAVVGIVLIARTATLAVLAPHPLALAGLWCASRTAMGVVATSVPYVGGGLAAAFLGADPSRRRPPLLLLGLPLAGFCAFLADGWQGAGAVAAVGLAAALMAAFAWRRIGGFTGDVLGACCVLGETVGLLVLSAQW